MKDFNLAAVRFVSINSRIVVGRRDQPVAEIKQWFENTEEIPADDVRVVSLLEEYEGKPLAKIVYYSDFETAELPTFLDELRRPEEESEANSL